MTCWESPRWGPYQPTFLQFSANQSENEPHISLKTCKTKKITEEEKQQQDNEKVVISNVHKIHKK